jgi:hypothetical protein
VEFYDRLSTCAGYEHFEAMSRFVRRLFRERELAGCTLYTSHEHLCVVRCPRFPEWLDRPTIGITCVGPNRVLLQLGSETAECDAESALDEFDRLYPKLLAADDDRPPRSEG